MRDTHNVPIVQCLGHYSGSWETKVQVLGLTETKLGFESQSSTFQGTRLITTLWSEVFLFELIHWARESEREQVLIAWDVTNSASSLCPIVRLAD